MCFRKPNGATPVKARLVWWPNAAATQNGTGSGISRKIAVTILAALPRNGNAHYRMSVRQIGHESQCEHIDTGGTGLFQGFCGGSGGRARGHYIVDEQYRFPGYSGN